MDGFGLWRSPCFVTRALVILPEVFVFMAGDPPVYGRNGHSFTYIFNTPSLLSSCTPCVCPQSTPCDPIPFLPLPHTNGNSTSLYVNTWIVTARVPYSPHLPSRGPKYETIYSPTDTRNAEPKTGEKGPWTFRGAATDP